jgi:hypothetical protein
LQAKLIHSSTLQQAFEQYPLNPNTEKMDGLITCLLPKQRWLSVYWEEGLADADLGELKATMIYPRRDQVRSRSRWQFANRDEFYEAYSVEEGL